jgi:outer membrane lipoprotein-sorting protein
VKVLVAAAIAALAVAGCGAQQQPVSKKMTPETAAQLRQALEEAPSPCAR